ncbi:YwiC-like family protein [Tessaracoccus sp. Y1736]
MAGRTAGWVPKQHGAWAMLVVPYLAGLVMARDARPLDAGDAMLGLTWLVAYFAYNAATLLLRSPAKRRGRYLPALALYSTATAVLGLTTLALKGWGLLLWAPVYAVLVGAGLWLAWKRRDRSLASGVLMVIASCGLMAVLQRWGADDPTRWRDVIIMLLITAYFVGTVLHVKALIRERNEPSAAQRSQAYHAAAALVAVAAWGAGWLGWWWLPWAVALVARSFWMPRAPRRPAQIGVLEILLSAWALALTLLG